MLAGLLATACATTGAEPASLRGGDWRVTRIGGAAVLPDSRAVITFDADGRFRGNASCNSMFGTWRADRSALSLSRVGLTRMLCQPAEMAQEQALVGLLEQVSAYRIEPPGTLVLTTPSGARIHATR